MTTPHTETITLRGRRVSQTKSALLIETVNGIRTWLPKSLTNWSPGCTNYEIPLWLARKKHLA